MRFYSAPDRFYHNVSHINSCLAKFESAQQLAQNPELIKFAIWYHDAVYNTKAKDNEEQSAQLAYRVCLVAQLPEGFAQGAKDLILATKHDVVPSGIDARLLIDADLSILGRFPEEFDAYEKTSEENIPGFPKTNSGMDGERSCSGSWTEILYIQRISSKRNISLKPEKTCKNQ